MKYKYLIFDMDGTILDTLDDLADSVNRALELHNFPKRTKEEIRSFLGNGMVKLIHLSVPEGTSKEEEAEILDEHKNYYASNSTVKTRAYEGIPELLSTLKAHGFKTAVVSNKSDSNVKNLVDKYFNGLFDVSIGARDGVPRKPERDLVDIAMKELGATKEDSVYIGDSDVDIATARNSELPMITVLWGFRDKDVLVKHGAENMVNNVKELEEMLL